MYKIVGGDQREYGPATSDQIREWIATGRANGQTLASFEGSPWKALSTYPEFTDALRTASPPPLAGAPGVYPTGSAQAYMGARTNNFAVAGLVLGVLGLCCSPVALVGVVLSVVGLIQISQNPQTYSTPKVVPILGIVIGCLAVVGAIYVLSTGAFSEIMKNMPR
jgi:hypothetical protein